MTDPDRTLLAILLDRSGSMASIQDDTEGGFNTFIDKQRLAAKFVGVTLAQFDTEYDVVYTNRSIDEVPTLDLQPRGGTALYDGIGRLITEVGRDLASLPESERPGAVTVVVLTDGHENSSREWTHDAVKAAITRQEQHYAWDFLFLGANMDAVAVGTSMGFAGNKSITYTTSSAGVEGAFAAAASYNVRKMSAPLGAPPVDGFSDEDRAGAAR
ncbi:vWA domain-containing protein [Williamsia sp. 1135]|uniref:vWA domain-containing protein n=1 Tax=Williamsia sp. 1135 TaxID=1889262 RepID=UPI000A115497|nr:vWA domain-containing protein [Williamsia sp. 1135]ORM31847.1 hypothetical protein BFL43_17405 [Williamsia sp. 1135]